MPVFVSVVDTLWSSCAWDCPRTRTPPQSTNGTPSSGSGMAFDYVFLAVGSIFLIELCVHSFTLTPSHTHFVYHTCDSSVTLVAYNFRFGTCNFPYPQFSRTLEYLNGLISNLSILTPASYRTILVIFHFFQWIKLNKISDP